MSFAGPRTCEIHGTFWVYGTDDDEDHSWCVTLAPSRQKTADQAAARIQELEAALARASDGGVEG